MSKRIEFGPQGELLIVPEVKKSYDENDPDFTLQTDYGRKLLQKLQQDYKPELVSNISGQSFPESASLAATPLFNEHGVNPSAVLIEAYGVADGWKIVLDDDPVNAGTCTESTKTITLSLRFMTSVAEARDTILHEIAHALQTRHHGTAFEAVLHEMRHKHRID